MTEEFKGLNQPQEEGQPEPQKAENLDNRLPYETPKLRKHGKINDATKTILALGPFDVAFGPGLADFS